MTRVIKVGGRVQEDARLASAIAGIWHAGAFPLVIVHGGGDAVTRLQKAFGVEARFEGGRRVTSEQDIELVRMALSGVANKQLVSALVSEGVRAVGISGEDDGLIGATPMDPLRFGHVGEVTTIRPALVHELIGAGLLPVISPVSRNATGTLGPALNVNGDDAAAVLAIALEASELLLVSDVPGVLVDGEVVGSLTSEGALTLISDGTAVKGMAAKLEAAVVALQGGVARVRICDLAGMSNPDVGTTLTVSAPSRRSLSSSASDVSSAAALTVGGLS